MGHEVVGEHEWLQARVRLLAKEKALGRLRDELAEARRALPWRRVEKPYVFDGDEGEKTLEELFAGKSQLIVYHFMFAPDWTEGCKSCSFWADNFERNVVHLAQRDARLVAVSRASLAKLNAYKQRLGWTFPWFSSGRSDFNFDYEVSFDPSRGAQRYNYAPTTVRSGERPGISVFHRNEQRELFHTYSTYSRGIELMNAGFHYLDLLPKGRDEGNAPMGWLRRRDAYDAG